MKNPVVIRMVFQYFIRENKQYESSWKLDEIAVG